MSGDTIRVSGRDNDLTVKILGAHTHDASGAVIINETEVETIMGEANADATVDETVAGAGAGGVNTGAAVGRSSGGTDTANLGTLFSESGHKDAADVGVEEAMSAIVASGLSSLQSLQAGINAIALRGLNDHTSISSALLSNLAVLANQQNQDGQNSSNSINKQSISHRDLWVSQMFDMDNIAEAAVARAMSKSSGTT